MGDVMSFQAIDDINNLVTRKIQSFRRTNAKITLPRATKAQLDDINEDSRKYKNEFRRINAETEAHQGGGQFRNIDSPQNVTVPTVFIQTVRRVQCERKQMIKAKRLEVKEERDSIKDRKKEADKEMHQLCDSLLREYQEGGMVSS